MKFSTRELLGAIRKYCVNCCMLSVKDVRNCDDTDCPLYKYRMRYSLTGKDKRLLKSLQVSQNSTNGSQVLFQQ